MEIAIINIELDTSLILENKKDLWINYNPMYHSDCKYTKFKYKTVTYSQIDLYKDNNSYMGCDIYGFALDNQIPPTNDISNIAYLIGNTQTEYFIILPIINLETVINNLTTMIYPQISQSIINDFYIQYLHDVRKKKLNFIECL